jgi:hypothetical protein
LRYVLDRTPIIDQVVLFATDQPRPATDEGFWNQDTLAFGQILQRLLRDRFGDRIGRIDCSAMTCNPADYDKTHAFFSEKLWQHVSPEGFDAIWLAPVGGTPASNTALLLNGIRLYGPRCQTIYVPPEKGQIQSLSLHKEILSQFAREEANAHLARRDFDALRDTLSRASLGPDWLRPICSYASARLRFDFAEASGELDKAWSLADGGEARSLIDRCRCSLAPLLEAKAQPDSNSNEEAWTTWQDHQRVLLAELYFNLRLTVLRPVR